MPSVISQAPAYEPLSPISFLRRSATVFPGRVAVVDGAARLTYGDLWDRATRMAGLLRDLGVRPGDRVAVLAPNTTGRPKGVMYHHRGAFLQALAMAYHGGITPESAHLWTLLDEERVTSLNAAPTVLIDFAAHPSAHRLDRVVAIGTGGAPPSPTVLGRLGALGFEVTHLYGLTETFDPSVVSEFPAD